MIQLQYPIDLKDTYAHARALHRLGRERERQEAKFGQQNHDGRGWLAVLMEEVGEASKDLMEKGEGAELEEVIQVAAVALAWAETILRRRESGTVEVYPSHPLDEY